MDFVFATARLGDDEDEDEMENDGARFRFKTEACCCWLLEFEELKPDLVLDDNETVFNPCGVIIFSI